MEDTDQYDSRSLQVPHQIGLRHPGMPSGIGGKVPGRRKTAGATHRGAKRTSGEGRDHHSLTVRGESISRQIQKVDWGFLASVAS